MPAVHTVACECNLVVGLGRAMSLMRMPATSISKLDSQIIDKYAATSLFASYLSPHINIILTCVIPQHNVIFHKTFIHCACCPAHNLWLWLCSTNHKRAGIDGSQEGLPLSRNACHDETLTALKVIGERTTVYSSYHRTTAPAFS